MQKVETRVGSGTLITMADFIVNSTAQGYFIVVKSQLLPDLMMAVLNTSSSAVVTGLEPGIYDILAYDVEETGLPNETPAVEIKNESVIQGSNSCHISVPITVAFGVK